MGEPQSIFERYYSHEPFADRYATNSDGAVDIIIPVLHSNELWRSNLISIYREVPVHRLRLGDAGCKDDTLAIAREFPRVEIYDHSSFKSLGYSVRELIKSVETEWFCYFHSDVYLPEGWFDTMRAHQAEYDWFGCPMRITALVEFPLVDKVRPYAGTQMGRKAAFVGGLDRIDDDYVYRQEDWVFAGIVEDGGFRHGRIEDTFHWHQVMQRVYGDDRRARKFKQVRFDVELTQEEEDYAAETQLRGTIKYLKPNAYHVNSVEINFKSMREQGKIDAEFHQWVSRTNPEWLAYLPSPPVVQAEALSPEQPLGAAESPAQPSADEACEQQEVSAPESLVQPPEPEVEPGRIGEAATSNPVNPIKALAKSVLPQPVRNAARRVERVTRRIMADQCRTIARLCEGLASRLSK
jgi:hypothetical protein